MRFIPNYKSANEIFAAIDIGSSWDFSSKANDGVLSARELRKAAGNENSFYLDGFLQHILWDLPPNDIARIRAAVPSALLDTVHYKGAKTKEPWHARDHRTRDLQFVTTTGVLRPLHDPNIENIRLDGANDPKRSEKNKYYEDIWELITDSRRRVKTIGDVFWLYQWVQQVDMSTVDESWPLVLSPKTLTRIPFSQPVRLMALWGVLKKNSGMQNFLPRQDKSTIEIGIFGEQTWNYLQRSDGSHKDDAYSHEDGNDRPSMMVLFCSPLDEDEATQMLKNENQNAHDVSAALLRQALAHRVT